MTCITACAGDRSNLLHRISGEQQANSGRTGASAHGSWRLPPPNKSGRGLCEFGSRRRRPCRVVPSWKYFEEYCAGAPTERSFRSSNAWRKTDSRSAGQDRTYASACREAQPRKPAKAKNHRGTFRTDRICVSSESLSGDSRFSVIVVLCESYVQSMCLMVTIRILILNPARSSCMHWGEPHGCTLFAPAGWHNRAHAIQ